MLYVMNNLVDAGCGVSAFSKLSRTSKVGVGSAKCRSDKSVPVDQQWNRGCGLESSRLSVLGHTKLAF